LEIQEVEEEEEEDDDAAERKTLMLHERLGMINRTNVEITYKM
jgi:hypothetical protein